MNLPTHEQLQTHVATLAAAPRNRLTHPDHLQRSRTYVIDQLEASGWLVQQQPFTVPAGIGVSDAGRPSAKWLPVRPRPTMQGVNIVATRGGVIDEQTLLIVAHLDTVRRSPGADDNASGVAVALEVAAAAHPVHPEPTDTSDAPPSAPEPSGSWPTPTVQPKVAIALVDLEEAGLAGSRALAAAVRPGAVINLESVGYYSDKTGSQHLPPGTGLAAPAVVKQVRRRERRGDFALVVYRADSHRLANSWITEAGRLGLATVEVQDRRPTAGWFRLVRPFDVVGSNLDRSDHGPFWDQGVPAVAVTGTAPMRNHRYHYDTDTPDTLDYDRLTSVALATVAVAGAWLSSGELREPLERS